MQKGTGVESELSNSPIHSKRRLQQPGYVTAVVRAVESTRVQRSGRAVNSARSMPLFHPADPEHQHKTAPGRGHQAGLQFIQTGQALGNSSFPTARPLGMNGFIAAAISDRRYVDAHSPLLPEIFHTSENFLNPRMVLSLSVLCFVLTWD